MSPEYFYGDVMRWSFGFENPNKAAVVFACLIPLFWAVWLAGIRLKARVWKVVVLAGTGLGFLACWGCLLLTFSRGGAVGAVSGMVVASFWAWRLPWRRAALGASMILIGIVLAAAMVFGTAERAADAMGEDASVGNRIELWSSGLQMAFENPGGFGAGNSGREFMQWYQPIERNEGYRTMVNSYLTFLVEWGWVAFAAAGAVLLAFWCWTWPGGGEERGARLRAALGGSLGAFLVSGVFSTTMEEPWLWILPGVVAGLLAAVRLRAGGRLVAGWTSGVGVCVFALVMGGLWLGGFWRSGNDPMARSFGISPRGGKTVTSVEPKASGSAAVGVMVDEAVLGEDWGKLVRSLAFGAGRRVVMMESFDRPPGTVVLVGERAVHIPDLLEFSDLILVAPEPFEGAFRGVILVPEIDEDGRGRFWAGRRNDGVRLVELTGVGTRVEWAWDQIVAEVAGR